ncbi:hypothetical protein EV178_001488 [Coemansia sp. RSA 1646]|nr:hypothetical protein EV178_001488 [Coemansia sp. RSA 1646]
MVPFPMPPSDISAGQSPSLHAHSPAPESVDAAASKRSVYHVNVINSYSITHWHIVKQAAGFSGGTTRTYRRHPKKDPNAPEKWRSAYQLFRDDVNRELHGQDIPFSDMSKIHSKRWAELSEDLRVKYFEQSNRDKEEYLRKMAAYEQTLEYKQYGEYLHNFYKQDSTVNRVGRPKGTRSSASKGKDPTNKGHLADPDEDFKSSCAFASLLQPHHPQGLHIGSEEMLHSAVQQWARGQAYNEQASDMLMDETNQRIVRLKHIIPPLLAHSRGTVQVSELQGDQLQEFYKAGCELASIGEWLYQRQFPFLPTIFPDLQHELPLIQGIVQMSRVAEDMYRLLQSAPELSTSLGEMTTQYEDIVRTKRLMYREILAQDGLASQRDQTNTTIYRGKQLESRALRLAQACEGILKLLSFTKTIITIDSTLFDAQNLRNDLCTQPVFIALQALAASLVEMSWTLAEFLAAFRLDGRFLTPSGSTVLFVYVVVKFAKKVVHFGGSKVVSRPDIQRSMRQLQCFLGSLDGSRTSGTVSVY